MSDPKHDAGVIAALVQRFERHRLPRALAIMDRVDSGATLRAADIEFLRRVFRDAEYVRPWANRHPEYQGLVVRSVSLYRQITARALDNEQRAP